MRQRFISRTSNSHIPRAVTLYRAFPTCTCARYSLVVSPGNGSRPVSIIYRITPHAKQSTAGPYGSCLID
jgi:hypothetical protein